MKKIGTYLIYGGALFFVIALAYVSISSDKKAEPSNANANTQVESSQKDEIQQNKPADKIQMFLFHSTNRCYSCITAGKYTNKLLKQSFSQEIESGKIEFREINVDLPENKEVANKFKASGTSLFINSIIDGQDNIKEDTQIWRLVANEKSFSEYLFKKLKGLISKEAVAQGDNIVKKEDIVFYFGDDCAECANIEKYLEENDVKNKIGLTEKNINKDEVAAQQMAEDAMYCNVDEESFGVPFLWTEGRCYAGEKNIINFFDEKLSKLK